MAETLEKMLEPGERVLWRDPGSVLRVTWPYVLMMGAVFTVPFGMPGGRHDVWAWDALLFPSLFVAAMLAMIWMMVDRRLGRPVEGVVTGGRVLYRAREPQAPSVALDLGEIAAVAVPADGSVEITRRNGETVLLPGLRRPQRFAFAAAEAARVPAPGLLGRMELFSANCWLLGGLACVIAVELLTYAITPTGPAGSLAASAGRVLFGVAVSGAALWTGAHLTCLFGLVVLRSRLGAGEVRAWLNTRRQGEHDSRIYRWSLWKSRPYFRLAALLWGEPMEAANGG